MNPINPYSIQSPPPFCQTIFPNLGNRNINLRDPHQFPLSGNKSSQNSIPLSKRQIHVDTNRAQRYIHVHAACVCVCVCQIDNIKPRKHYYKEE